MKKRISLILVFALVMGVFAIVPLTPTANATSVDGLKFELNDDGESYCVSGYTESVPVELVIPDTYNSLPVTSIGSHAFEDCFALTSVMIPDGITSIGDYAFNSCVVLTSVTIPDSVTTIGEGAFYYCVALTSISIPNSVTNIGESAFAYCNGLENVTLENGITSLGILMFEGCRSLTSITIPDTVTTIGAGAFYECFKLKNITIPENVKIIDEATFYYCKDLVSVTVPDSVTEIHETAFAECSKELVFIVDNNDYVMEYAEKNNFNYILNSNNKETLVFELNNDGQSYSVVGNNITTETELVIPDIYNDLPVTNVAEAAFFDCTSLTSVIIPDSVTSIGNNVFENCISLVNIIIPDSITSIGHEAFYYCSSLASIIIPDSVISMGGSVFSFCTSLSSIVLPSSVTSIGHETFWGCSSLTSVTIPNSILNIGVDAFSGCTSLTNITIPDSVASIGWGAFSYCTSLESITIPDSVTSIGNEAFCGCTSLKSITIPDSVTSIGKDAFFDTAYWYNQENWVDNALYINNQLIVASASGDYVVNSGTKSIADGAFEECPSLVSVTIPDSVTSIGKSAFAECISLTSVTIPDSVTSIGDAAFCNCTSLDSITIPDSVIITSSVFYNTGYYNDINNWKNGVLYLDNHLVKAKDTLSGVYTIKTGIKYIDGNAFSDCNMLESVVIPNSVTYIGPWAFYNCESLVNITIPETVTNIEDHAFGLCKKLVNVTLPAGVKSIGFMAFNGCFSLYNLTLPQSLNTIDNAAFEFCEKLEYIFYEGTSTEWENLKIGSFNEKLTMAKIHYNSTGHSHSCSMERAPTEQENGKAIDTCPVCGFINGEEDIVYINDYITTVDTKNAVVDATTNTLLLDISACKDINEAIVEMDGYTLTTTPISSYGFIGTGSKLQVADSTGTQVAEYTLVVRGDVNGDSVCDVLDCMLLELARHESNNVSLEGVYFAAGNLAEDNEINIDDVKAVVNKALDLV